MQWYLMLFLCSVCADIQAPGFVDRIYVEMPSEAACAQAKGINPANAPACQYLDPSAARPRLVEP